MKRDSTDAALGGLRAFRKPAALLAMGIVTGFALQLVVRAVQYVAVVHPRLPAVAEDHAEPTQPMAVDPGWLLEGDPKFSSRAYYSSHDGSTVSGIWICDGPGKFRWRHDTDESLYVLEGVARIEHQGGTYTLQPGDTAFFKAGSWSTWNVPGRVRKSFTLHSPDRMTRWLRRLL